MANPTPPTPDPAPMADSFASAESASDFYYQQVKARRKRQRYQCKGARLPLAPDVPLLDVDLELILRDATMATRGLVVLRNALVNGAQLDADARDVEGMACLLHGLVVYQQLALEGLLQAVQALGFENMAKAYRCAVTG